MTPLTARLQVQNKISLIRVEGRLTDESLTDCYEASRDYLNTTDARVSIVDLSSVSEFALSSGLIRSLAVRKLANADSKLLCFLVAPEGHAFGLCHMFQICGDATRPLLQVVHTLAEVFAAIGIQSPFEPPAVWAPVIA
jgi:hypothetical protein